MPWEPLFLQTLERTGSVTRAWKEVGLKRGTVYEARNNRPSFAKAWDDIRETHVDNLEASAMARAIGGVEEPVIFKGKVMKDPTTGKVLTVQKFDSALTMFMLKANRPERYKGCDWRGFDGDGKGGSGSSGPLERAQAVRAALEELERSTVVPPPAPPGAATSANGNGATPSNGNGAHA